jgi:hypothetical protein
MNVEIEWQEPLALRSLSVKDVKRVRARLKDEPGIYVFARRWGSDFEALYVGQALKVLGRVTQQFNNRKLVDYVLNAKIGAKVLLTGYLVYNGTTNIKKSLNTAERAYIRNCIARGHPLHNTQGTKVRTDEVNSIGGRKRSVFPTQIVVESKI